MTIVLFAFQPTNFTTNSFGSLLKSIAVLPFQNLSVDPSRSSCRRDHREYSRMAQIKDCESRTKFLHFVQGSKRDLRSVGTKLNVTTSLKERCDAQVSIRITATHRCVSGYQLWSERYDRVLEDIFNVQDEIALAIVDALKLNSLAMRKKQSLGDTRTTPKSMSFLKKVVTTPKIYSRRVDSCGRVLREVIEKNPDHAPAHAGKAASLGCLLVFRIVSRRRGRSVI